MLCNTPPLIQDTTINMDGYPTTECRDSVAVFSQHRYYYDERGTKTPMYSLPGDQGSIDKNSITIDPDDPTFATVTNNTLVDVMGNLRIYSDLGSKTIRKWLVCKKGTRLFGVDKDMNTGLITATVLKTVEEDQSDVFWERVETCRNVLLFVEFLVIVVLLVLFFA